MGAGKSSSKPLILVSGDDAGFVSVLSPVNEESTSWEYSEMFIVNSTGTIGSPSVGDVDGNGAADVFIPFYSDNKVEMYTYDESGATPISQKCVACLKKKDPVHLSPAYNWCYKDNQCHVVGSPVNPCAAAQCASEARTSSCACTSCNDHGCSASLGLE